MLLLQFNFKTCYIGKSSLTAGDIVNSWPEAEIGRIIRVYGEERQWKRLARKISEVQLLGGINSTSHLLQLIQECVPLRFSPGFSLYNFFQIWPACILVSHYLQILTIIDFTLKVLITSLI